MPEAIFKCLEDPHVQNQMCSTGFQGGRNRTKRWELQGYRLQLSTRKNWGQLELYGLPCRVVSSPSLQVFMLKLDDQPTGRDVVGGF